MQPESPSRRQQLAALLRSEIERRTAGSPDEDHGEVMLLLEGYTALVQLDAGTVNDIVRPAKPAADAKGEHARAPSPAFGLVRESVLYDCIRYVMAREACGQEIAIGIVAHDTGAARAEALTAYNNREYREGASRHSPVRIGAGRVADPASYERACNLLRDGVLPARPPDGRRRKSSS